MSEIVPTATKNVSTCTHAGMFTNALCDKDREYVRVRERAREREGYGERE